VSWCIFGPNNASQPLVDYSDVSVVTPNGTQVTSGILYWADGEAGTKAIVLSIKPPVNGAWEVAKQFVISLWNISGTPSTSGNGDISPTASSVTLQV